MSDIEKLLPHREPFLFVDRIEKADDEEIIGYRKFTEKDFFFKGHFPGYPVVPGVILIETMAQCGGAGIRLSGKLDEDALFFLASVDKVKIRHQVRQGDEVKMVIKNLRVSPKTLKQSGRAYVGEQVAAEAEWLCILGMS
ncbi:MAG: 3-hydroxyacyl-ACP dehydratase FabZ [Spirochaetaceae bacterium]|nr:MAG: 3-hydroxyacyl-ACP dehydratase FabZ [Spirochaetaceae bacterium]